MGRKKSKATKKQSEEIEKEITQEFTEISKGEGVQKVSEIMGEKDVTEKEKTGDQSVITETETVNPVPPLPQTNPKPSKSQNTKSVPKSPENPNLQTTKETPSTQKSKKSKTLAKAKPTPTRSSSRISDRKLDDDKIEEVDTENLERINEEDTEEMEDEKGEEEKKVEEEETGEEEEKGEEEGKSEEEEKEVEVMEDVEKQKGEVAKEDVQTTAGEVLEKKKRVKQVAKKRKAPTAKPVEKTKPVTDHTPQKKKKKKEEPQEGIAIRRGKSIELPFNAVSKREILRGMVCPTTWVNQTFLGVVKEAIEFQGWSGLFDKQLEVYDDVVREFYTFLGKEGESLWSQIEETTVKLNAGRLMEVLGIPGKGFCDYSKDSWPFVPKTTTEQLKNRLFIRGAEESSGLVISQLKEPSMRVLHTIVTKMLLPRGQGRVDVRKMDAALIYCLLEKVKVNLPVLMIEHMLHSVDRSTHSLPYGGWLTLVFQKKGVPLTGKVSKMAVLTNQILGQKGMEIDGNVLKMKDSEDQSRGETSNRSGLAEQLMLRIDNQNVLLEKMMTGITELCSSIGPSLLQMNKRLDLHEKKLVTAGVQGKGKTVKDASTSDGEDSKDEGEEESGSENNGSTGSDSS